MALGNKPTTLVQILELDDGLATAIEHYLLKGRFQLLKGSFDIKAIMVRQRAYELKIIGVAAIPAAHGAAGQAQLPMDDHPFRIKKLFYAQPVASRTGPGRVVE